MISTFPRHFYYFSPHCSDSGWHKPLNEMCNKMYHCHSNDRYHYKINRPCNSGHSPWMSAAKPVAPAPSTTDFSTSMRRRMEIAMKSSSTTNTLSIKGAAVAKALQPICSNDKWGKNTRAWRKYRFAYHKDMADCFLPGNVSSSVDYGLLNSSDKSENW